MTVTIRHRVNVAIPGGNLLVSDDAVWGVWKPPRHSYTGLSDDARVSLRARILAGLSGLRDVELHLLMTPTFYGSDEWLHQLFARYPNRAPGGDHYYRAQALRLDDTGDYDTDLDLLIKIADRHGDDLAHRIIRRGQHVLGVGRTAITDRELNDWRANAERIGATLTSHLLRARAATPAEVAALVKHSYHRGVIQPPVPVAQRRYGHGAVRALGEAFYGTPGLYDLPLCDADGNIVQYLAWLTVCDVPLEQRWPGSEWLADDLVPFPIIRSVRGRTMQMRELSEQAGRARSRAEDQIENTRGTDYKVPPEMRQAGQELGRIREQAAAQHASLALVDLHIRIGVMAPDRHTLTLRTQAVIDAYRAMGIMVERGGGDQLRINAEAQPGGRVYRIGGVIRDPHDHKAPLETLAGSGAFFTHRVGDGVGPVFARLPDGSAVKYDPFYAATKEGGDRSIGAVVAGKSGHSGKTTAALLTAAHTVWLGGVSVFIDPSSSTTRIAAELGGDDPRYGLGDVREVHLGDGSIGRGSLDPYLLAGDPRDQTAYVPHATDVAVAALQMLLEPELTRGAYGRALTRACREVATMPVPMLRLVPIVLREHADERGAPELNDLAEAIEQASEFPAGKTMFAEPGDKPLRIGRGMTILSVRGLRMPRRDKRQRDYTRRDREAVTLLYLLAEYVRLIVHDPELANIPVHVTIDEAWAITGTEQGANLISELYRDGRKRWCSLWVLSQDPADFPMELVENAGLRLIGACESDHGAAAALRMLSLEDTPAMRQWLRNQPPHTFVMQTGEVTGLGRATGTIRVWLMFDRLRRAFDTSPAGEAESAA